MKQLPVKLEFVFDAKNDKVVVMAFGAYEDRYGDIWPTALWQVGVVDPQEWGTLVASVSEMSAKLATIPAPNSGFRAHYLNCMDSIEEEELSKVARSCDSARGNDA